MRAKDLGQNFGRDPQLVKRTGVSEAESWGEHLVRVPIRGIVPVSPPSSQASEVEKATVALSAFSEEANSQD